MRCPVGMYFLHLTNPKFKARQRVARTVEPTNISSDREEAFARVIVVAAMDDDGGKERTALIDLMQENLTEERGDSFSIRVVVH